MSYLLAFLLLCIFLSNAAGDSCAEGFMDLSLLETKAATPVGSLADDILAENNETRWIITDDDKRFTCDNVILRFGTSQITTGIGSVLYLLDCLLLILLLMDCTVMFFPHQLMLAITIE